MSSAFQRRVERLRQHVQGQGKPPKGESLLEQLTVPELKEIAKEKGIEGFSNMNKAALIEVIREAELAKE